jgi:hypothetical protein
MFSLQQPRHIPTLPPAVFSRCLPDVRYTSKTVANTDMQALRIQAISGPEHARYLAVDRLRASEPGIVCEHLPVGHGTRGLSIVGHRFFERERDPKHFQV